MDHRDDGSRSARGLDDPDLVRRLKLGRQDAWNTLVRQTRERLAVLAFTMTRDREESLEVVQDVYEKAFRNMEAFRGESGILTWLRKITLHTAMNWRRRWGRRFRWHHQPMAGENDGPAPGPETETATPESSYQEKEVERMVGAAMEQLPMKLRAVLVLRTVEELSYDEIAETLSISPGTVASRLSSARQRMAAALDREGNRSGSGPSREERRPG